MMKSEEEQEYNTTPQAVRTRWKKRVLSCNYIELYSYFKVEKNKMEEIFSTDINKLTRKCQFLFILLQKIHYLRYNITYIKYLQNFFQSFMGPEFQYFSQQQNSPTEFSNIQSPSNFSMFNTVASPNNMSNQQLRRMNNYRHAIVSRAYREQQESIV